MEQRRLRLGDILDDYCPRERRVTNHAVVAMIEEDVKQTRCTTCDAEHAYKGGKEPRRRKKDSAAVLYKEVLAGMPEAVDTMSEPIATEPIPPPSAVEPIAAESDAEVPAETPETPEEPPAEEPRSDGDEGPFHRRLIRATLPRPEGQKEIRQIPEFTIRQNGGRGNGHQNFRGGSKMRSHGGNGHHPHGSGGRRFGPSAGSGRGPSTGPGRGPSGGSGRGPSAGPGRPGRNRKRSR